MQLDEFDLRILEILQRDNRTPQRDIGEAVNLSATAVQRRIRRMEDSGVIAANVAQIDPQQVGLPLTLIVEIMVESERPELLQRMQRRFADSPQVQQCYSVTGEVDFVLVMVVRDMADYALLAKQLFDADSNVRKFRTLAALERVKVGLQLPLP
ncbi:MAG: DNA-binding transcriptional activator DecR [Herbaspirillum frisingense]|uniref:DNA-binding transcriptional activator DecR n=1 Tax=Herbaspirillum frisingense TaxID=92645 RepID=A0A7V8FYN4_9BURK|nr:MAG: DNA-binding transcriptional activator DecR [Herbaspirillum frisingense]